jgi:hypothetical protein
MKGKENREEVKLEDLGLNDVWPLESVIDM